MCIMGQNCEKFIGMCLESVKDADNIVYCDGGSSDGTLELVKKYNRVRVIENKYNQEDKGMNGKQRNFYLNYLKENYKGYWALCLDVDECVDDLNKIKQFIQLAAKDKLYSVKMRHFIGDLGHEDATQPQHHVPNRLFYIGDDLSYPEVEHPILQGIDREEIRCNIVTIWHLSYITACFDIRKKYENHLKKSNIHTKDYLKNWYFQHLFGVYPKSQISLLDIPDVILNYFGINKDEIYFNNRRLEVKHFEMFRQWYDFFKPEKVLDIGAGLGHFGFVAKNYFMCEYLGLEKSKWAVENSYKDLDIRQQDITEGIAIPDNYDLVLVLDILEHLEEKDLNKVLKNISQLGKHFIFSIPFEGDSNLLADSTHKIFKSKDWWIEKLSEYFKVQQPKEWLFSNQILIGERK